MSIATAGDLIQWHPRGHVLMCDGPTESAFARRYPEHPEELWREEGVQTVVSIRTDGKRRVMYLDGLHQASDVPEMVRLHSEPMADVEVLRRHEH